MQGIQNPKRMHSRQWARALENAFDGFSSNDFRIQFTGRLNFAMPLVAKQEK